MPNMLSPVSLPGRACFDLMLRVTTLLLSNISRGTRPQTRLIWSWVPGLDAVRQHT